PPPPSPLWPPSRSSPHHRFITASPSRPRPSAVVRVPTPRSRESVRHTNPCPDELWITGALWITLWTTVDNPGIREAALARGRSEGRRTSVPGGRTERVRSYRTTPL